MHKSHELPMPTIIKRPTTEEYPEYYQVYMDQLPEGDVLFPPIDPELWRIVAEPEVPPSDKDSASFRVRVYERR